MGMLIALALLPSGSAWSIEQEISLSQLNRRSWNSGEVAPTHVSTFLQDKNGDYWLAGDQGVLGFNGIRFIWMGRTMQSLHVTAGLIAADGSHWFGFQAGGVSRTHGNDVANFTENEGLPSGRVHNIVQDSAGVLWVASYGGIARFENDRWQRVDATEGFDADTSMGAFVDREGTLWIATPTGVLSRRKGARRFARVFDESLTNTTAKVFAQAPDGTVWMNDPGRGLMRINPPRRSGNRAERLLGGERIGAMLFDRDGNLWMGGDRLRRIAAPVFDADARPGPIETLGRAQGLSGDLVTSLYEDHAGNLWIGTSGGIDRLNRSNILWIDQPGLDAVNALVAGDAGTLWVAQGASVAGESALLQFERGQFVRRLPAPAFTAAIRDLDGQLWFASREGVARMRLEGGAPSFEVTSLPEPASGFDVQAMVRDRAGALWVAIERRGMFRWLDGKWTRNGDLAALPMDPPTTAILDTQGNVWFGYTRSRLARIDGDSVRLYTEADGLRIGHVTALQAQGTHLWVGGELALARFDGQDFMPINNFNCEPFAAATGIVETGGELWLFRYAGIARLPDIDTQLKQPYKLDMRASCTGFDEGDTAPPNPKQVRPVPSLVQTSEGRLWVAASQGLAWIDPTRHADIALPVAAILTVRAGSDYHLPVPGMELPANTRDLRVEFTASNVKLPETVRFRYRLIGVDHEWRATSRREAQYLNLGPGHYRFEVNAVNADDVWSQQPDSIEFTIPPTFYQSTWFRSLCVLAGIAVILLIYQWQMKRASARLRARLEERVVERERIARELHDTLLQGLQGLILHFQAAAYRISNNDPARQMLEKALERADDVIIESRERVKDLRDVSGGPTSLPQDLAAFGNELAEQQGIEFSLVTHGDSRGLHPIVREEIFLIAREAIVNAFRHAQPRRVEAELFHEKSALRVRVRDDGRGVDPEVLRAGGRKGHWGLIGMQERAKKIRGQLDIWSREGAGTEIELRVPASMAYVDNRKKSRAAVDHEVL